MDVETFLVLFLTSEDLGCYFVELAVFDAFGLHAAGLHRVYGGAIGNLDLWLFLFIVYSRHGVFG